MTTYSHDTVPRQFVEAGASSGTTPNTIPAMATDAIAFIKALRISKTDSLGYSVDRSIRADRPSSGEASAHSSGSNREDRS